MARHLHTAVGDEIRRIEQTDPIQAAEMRMESIEYANEVRGMYDRDDEDCGPDEYDDREPENYDETVCGLCGSDLDDDEHCVNEGCRNSRNPY